MQTAKRSIRVNAISPGWVTTEGMGRPLTESVEAYKKHAAVMPMNRLATPVEIAKVDLFLASDEASFITGAILPVDGGYSASKRLEVGKLAGLVQVMVWCICKAQAGGLGWKVGI